jgi:flavin-dependent dehydrogenase
VDVVVGAGAAGLTTARALAAAGLAVRVLERPRVRYDSGAMAKRKPAPIAERLQAVLERIDRPGTFCVGGARCRLAWTRGRGHGVGSIWLPLTAAQARALRRRCEQAP